MPAEPQTNGQSKRDEAGQKEEQFNPGQRLSKCDSQGVRWLERYTSSNHNGANSLAVLTIPFLALNSKESEESAPRSVQDEVASRRSKENMTIQNRNTTIALAATPPRAQGAMGQLDHDELLVSHNQTLDTPRRRYGPGAKALFAMLDLIYGKPRTLSKFKVLELVARVPYQAWEQVAYIAITHTHDRPDFARRVFDRVTESRSQEDNEQWHLLILEELIARSGTREG